jgi:hypothetical protein
MHRLDCGFASFEALLRKTPQDEVLFSMPSKAYLILRSAYRARLEGRTVLMQRRP